MRFIIFGAGGVGGVVAAKLHQAGRDVVAVARGPHYERMQTAGLRLETPDTVGIVDLLVVNAVSSLELTADDVVVLTMKSQDTDGALASLAACAPSDIAVVCAQNGVENERAALRRFPNVYGMCVMLPATFVEPGVVQANGHPTPGILDVGRYPSGTGEVAASIADGLRSAGLSSEPVADIMRWKYAKLLMNLGNSIDALCPPSEAGRELGERARVEAEACFAAAGIEYASADEDAARRGDLFRLKPIGGQRRGGGSTWQSLARGGSIETDYLNGEIVLLGRLHGVPTPVNAVLQRAMWEAAAVDRPPHTVDAEDLLMQVDKAR
jgi:2-dehydropantoate 2-reductase